MLSLLSDKFVWGNKPFIAGKGISVVDPLYDRINIKISLFV